VSAVSDEEFDDQSEDELKKAVERSSDDAQLARELQQAELERRKQQNRLRSIFFWVASGLAGATVLTSVVMVIVVLAGADIEAAVAVAFISGLAVETVGVLAVMAGYLFPRDRRSE
jgi:hypothetical protein